MTTTKEDRIREEFCLWFDKVSPDEFTKLGAWQACAEFYEKKLAESNDLWKDLRNVLECTQRNLSEVNARNARLVESLELVHTCSCTICADCADAVRRGINANAESVAAWEAEKLEPLRREVAMLRRCLDLFPQHSHNVFDLESECEICTARNNTQATAEAYEREIAAKSVTNLAVEWLPHMKRKDCTSSVYQTLHNLAVDDCIKHSLSYAAELRAANKGKEVV